MARMKRAFSDQRVLFSRPDVVHDLIIMRYRQYKWEEKPIGS
ncbi:MAG: hypothetical protein ACLQPD_14885 [Desulfomonilaceae bacterium]